MTAAANILPTVSITSPISNSVYQAVASSITIDAVATDVDGTISKVDFYNGATLLDSDVSFPYSMTWNNVIAGTYTITAVATDNVNASKTSTAIVIIVNEKPSTSIVSPSNNTSFTELTNITIDAIANDNDGTISKVEFFEGTNLIGTDLNFPYTFTWDKVAIGNYLLKTKVTDNNGGITYSSGINVVVTKVTNINIQTIEHKTLYPNPTTGIINFGNGISDVQISTIDGKLLPISYSPNENSIDIQSLKNGIYLVRFKKEGNIYIEKITKY